MTNRFDYSYADSADDRTYYFLLKNILTEYDEEEFEHEGLEITYKAASFLVSYIEFLEDKLK